MVHVSLRIWAPQVLFLGSAQNWFPMLSTPLRSRCINLEAPVKRGLLRYRMHIWSSTWWRWKRPPQSVPVWALWKHGRIAAVNSPDHTAVISSPGWQAPTLMCSTWSFVPISLAHCLLGNCHRKSIEIRFQPGCVHQFLKQSLSSILRHAQLGYNFNFVFKSKKAYREKLAGDWFADHFYAFHFGSR